jgi:hypothetical protein
MREVSVSRILSVVCVTFLAALPLLAAADANDADTSILERVLIESASTPKAHRALANYYRGKADEARKTAELHRGMGRAYSGMKVVLFQQQKEHCKRLASLETEKAKEYTALAAGHDAEAKR